MKKIKIQAKANGCRVAGSGGSAIALAPGEIREIPEHLLQAFLYTGGCKVLKDEPVVVQPPEPEDKTEKIKAVLQRMVDEGNPEDFTTTGEPRVSVVKENLDGDVTKTEVMAVYDELMST